MTRIIGLPLITLISLLLLAPTANARTQPVYNIIDKPVHSGSGNMLTLEQVGDALAAAARYKRWTVEEVEPGYMTAQIFVRQHFAAIDIRYTKSTYSITYRDSEVLKYDGEKIHRNYNKWVKLIEKEADQNLLRL